MEINWKEAKAYLEGHQFNEGGRFKVIQESVRERTDELVDLARAKRVVHIGCVDHLPILDKKIANGTWLHGRLLEVAADCVGVDTNIAGVRDLTRRGYQRIYEGDIASDPVWDKLKDEEWDYAILGEVVEHLDDPVSFLFRLATRFQGRIRRVIITVPNAFSLLNIAAAVRNVERINTDHRYWFSPYTIQRVAVAAGLKPIEVRMTTYAISAQLRGRIKRILMTRWPLLADDVLLIAEL